MPKMTAKYSAAIDAAHNARLKAVNTHNQEELYELLQRHGYFWDSSAKRWEYHPQEEAAAPAKTISIRVWADGEITEEVADDLTAALRKYANTKGWQLVDRSRPYPCRPPKQLESRVYLKFIPGGKNA